MTSWFVQPPIDGSDVWRRFRGKLSGTMKGCWLGPALEEEEDGEKKKGAKKTLGDGKQFTKGEEVWKVGGVVEECWLAFGVADTLALGE